MRDTHEALRRIAAMLLALAVLAERAAVRSLPVRCLVLWILRRAEARASAFAAEVAPLIPADYPAFQSGDGPDDAARLAETFRALAAIFFALAHRAQPLARRQRFRRPDPGRLSCLNVDRRLLQAIAALRPRYVDTS